MFVIGNDTNKSSMKPNYSVISRFSMAHPYKWAIADVLSEKKALFSTLNPTYNQL